MNDEFSQAPHDKDACRELDLCLPIIEDVLRDYYGLRCKGDAATIAVLVRIHSQCWRQVLAGYVDRAVALHGEVVGVAGQCNLDASEIDGADAAVLGEITDIIVTRFRRSTYDKTSYCERLLAAGQLFIQTNKSAA